MLQEFCGEGAGSSTAQVPAVVAACTAWAAQNASEFTQPFQEFLEMIKNSDNAEMISALLAKDPFDLADRIVGGDHSKALNLYIELHQVIYACPAAIVRKLQYTL